MRFVKTDLDHGDVEIQILRKKVNCDRCGVTAALRAIFYYCPEGVDSPLSDGAESAIVVAIKCPVCGPQTQVKAADFEIF
jgi:Zn finger protein HypA/HybF involved in hydrogenase expression